MVAVATAAVFTGVAPVALSPHAVAPLTTGPDGGWTQVIEPRAIEHDGILYFAFIDGDDGHIKVGSFDGTTTTLSTVGTAPQVDTHDAPVIHIRSSDERLMVFWSGHVTADMFLRVSTNPLDVSSWGAEVNLDSQLGGHFYTYPNIVEFDNGDMYLVYRDHAGTGPTDYARMAFSVSTDDGATWAAQTLVLQQASRDPYWVVGSDGTRIDIATSDGHPAVESSTTIRHLYYDGAWKGADGSSLGSPPFTVTSLPLVFTGGKAWPSSIVPGPAISYEVVGNVDSDDYRIARWNGSSWELTQIAISNGAIESGVAPHSTLTDSLTLYASVKVGSYFEIQRFKAGAMTPVTTGSSVDNIYPARIHGGRKRKVVWLSGTYTTFLDTDLAVWAGR